MEDFVPARQESVQDSRLKVRAELKLRARLYTRVSGKYIEVVFTSLEVENEWLDQRRRVGLLAV